MQGEILLISKRAEDQEFWRKVASLNSMGFHQETDTAKLRKYLRSNPGSLVFWDAEDGADQKEVEQLLNGEVPAVQVFAVTDSPINRQHELLKPPAFGHHIFRRYDEPAPFLYTKLIEAAVSKDPFGLERYFPAEHQARKFAIQRSTERLGTVEKIQEFFEGYGANPRIARVGTDASDELLMNAIFDAPYDSGKGGYYRKDFSRSQDFSLTGKEVVDVQVAACDQFLGISVVDHFGSLKREVVLKHLCQDFREDDYVPPKDKTSAGIGLHRINQQALALLFVSRPGERTEVMVFFSNSKNYREFRLGFCFFSIFSE